MLQSMGNAINAEELPVKVAIKDVRLFVLCCKKKDEMLHRKAAPEEWLLLAEEFQKAKGQGRHSVMAEWCRNQARVAGKQVKKG